MKSHGENVPSDWGQYYTKCLECGERYHLSEVHECVNLGGWWDDDDYGVEDKERGYNK